MQRGVYGTNAISFKFRNGVIIGVDTGATYGGASVGNIQRVSRITENCIAAFSGLLSDIQFLKKFIRDELESDDARKMDPQGIHKMVQRILYARRSQGKPMMVSVIVCGVNPKENGVFEATDEIGRMVGVVNSKGNFWFDSSAALSLSSNFVLPILRERDLDELSKDEAIALMEECFKILCYKDCRSTNRIQIAVAEPGKVEILDPYCLRTDWSIGLNEGEILLQQ